MKDFDEFNFDEWADLYRTDPEAFEARRQAMFAMQLARAPIHQAESARALLREFDRRAEGQSDRQRLETATMMAVESMNELTTRLQTLRRSLIDTTGPR